MIRWLRNLPFRRRILPGAAAAVPVIALLIYPPVPSCVAAPMGLLSNSFTLVAGFLAAKGIHLVLLPMFNKPANPGHLQPRVILTLVIVTIGISFLVGVSDHFLFSSLGVPHSISVIAYLSNLVATVVICIVILAWPAPPQQANGKPYHQSRPIEPAFKFYRKGVFKTKSF